MKYIKYTDDKNITNYLQIITARFYKNGPNISFNGINDSLSSENLTLYNFENINKSFIEFISSDINMLFDLNNFNTEFHFNSGF